MILELAWTRSLVLVLGGSVYAFALMLAGALLGIALGGAFYARRAEGLQRPAKVLAWGYAGLALLIFLQQAALGWMPAFYFALFKAWPEGFAAAQGLGIAVSLAVLLPVGALQGFLYPLALRLAGQEGARRDSAALGWLNALGGALAALLGGLLLMPKAGIQPLFGVAAGLAGLAAALALPASPQNRRAMAAAALLLGGLGAAFFRPWDRMQMLSGVFQQGVFLAEGGEGKGLGELLRGRYALPYYAEGAEAVVGVRDVAGEGERSLLINGKVDASVKGDRATQSLLAQIPLCLKPEAKSAYVVGWGSGGSVASALLHPLESVDCLEIEAKVAEAAPWFQADPAAAAAWKDPRLRLRIGDARRDLQKSPRAYDVIISEPSNPWISGVANLFTADFYALARRRLNPGGIFCQWFHSYCMEPEAMRLQLRTFAASWPSVSLWIVPPRAGELSISGDLILLGSEAEPDLEAPAALARLESPEIRAELQRADCCGSAEAESPVVRDRWWLWSLRLLGSDELRAFAGAGPLNTDERPRLEFLAPKGLALPLQRQRALTAELMRSLQEAATSLVPPLKSVPEAEALERLGRHYSERALFPRAKAALSRALQLGRKGALLELGLARALFYGRELEAALPHFKAAFASQPKEYQAFLRKGGEFLRLGRPDMALGVFDTASQLRPRDADAHFGRGVCLSRLGRTAEARQALETALALNPGLAPARQALAELGTSL
jgi:spermidine synthase